MIRPPAMLLLGPTGSGKTPLGELLETGGLAGRRCAHFDFGERLRQIAAGELNVPELADADRAFIVEVLQRGALLEDEHFHIAEKILRAFIVGQEDGEYTKTGCRDSRRPDGPEQPRQTPAMIVLNGLPRHIGQAADVDRIANVRLVVELVCTPETVLARLAADPAGDRTRRVDDKAELIRRKLDIYARRTAPLVEHYRQRGAKVICLSVGPETTAKQMSQQLETPDA